MKNTFNFNKFIHEYKKNYPNKNIPNKDFLEWFIGFSEGDGCFTNSKNNNILFIIFQSNKDKEVLKIIQDNLGFGSINKQNKNVDRFIVRKKSDINIIINIFNGNIILPSKKFQFKKWIVNKDITINNNIIIPSNNNFWISGFTDAEGCFQCSILYNSIHAYRFRYIVAQKHKINKPILEQFVILFGGYVNKHYIKDVYQYTLNGVRNINNIIKYFEKYNLKSKKIKSYTIWKNIYYKIKNKEHIDSISRAHIKYLSKTINKLKSQPGKEDVVQYNS